MMETEKGKKTENERDTGVAEEFYFYAMKRKAKLSFSGRFEAPYAMTTHAI